MPDPAKNRVNKLTSARIKKEIEFLTEVFAEIKDEAKKTLIKSAIEEAAFLKVACIQAKEEMKKEGLTVETKNAAQKFIKAHPSAMIYEKYSRLYTQIINNLIEYLPVKIEDSEFLVDDLLELRNS